MGWAVRPNNRFVSGWWLCQRHGECSRPPLRWVAGGSAGLWSQRDVCDLGGGWVCPIYNAPPPNKPTLTPLYTRLMPLQIIVKKKGPTPKHTHANTPNIPTLTPPCTL